MRPAPDPESDQALIAAAVAAFEARNYQAMLDLARDARARARQAGQGVTSDILNIEGQALAYLRRPVEAIACYRQALVLTPKRWDIMSHLATALFDLDQFGEALTLFRAAYALAPGRARVVANLANLLDFSGDVDQALKFYAAAMALDPRDSGLACNYGMCLLRAGRLAEGWPLFEHRRRVIDPTEATTPILPPLAGLDLAGRRILLFHEQGYGDTLQMLRYIPALAARGAEILLRLPPPLVRLGRAMPGVAAVFTDEPGPVGLDYQAPMMRLPLVFGTDLGRIPAETPYLPASDGAVWRQRLAALPRPWVGLVWAGSPDGGMDHRRSMPFSELLPVFRAQAGFVNLQLGAASAAWAPPGGVASWNPTAELGDFADTAGLVSQLDLVIAVDTSIIHLAGGLGIPVALLSRFSSCWRWLMGRSDSPWYPGLRIYRQDYPGKWAKPVDLAAKQLAAFSSP